MVGGSGDTIMHGWILHGPQPGIGTTPRRKIMNDGERESLDAEGTADALALHGAAHLGDAATLRSLLDAGADVNVVDGHGVTALAAALGAGCGQEILALLVSAGADPHAIDDFGCNAFHAALGSSLQEGFRADTLLAVLSWLKRLGVDLEHRGAGGRTPLAEAIIECPPDAVQALCDLGANPNVTCPVPKSGCGGSCGGRSSHEAPLLFHAVGAYDRDRKLVSLLNAGANVLASDAEGHTALTIAVGSLLLGTPDMAARFRAFFKQFEPLARQHEHASGTRDEVIARVAPAIRAIVDEMLRSLPPLPRGGRGNVERAQTANSIVILGAYEIWARCDAGQAQGSRA